MPYLSLFIFVFSLSALMPEPGWGFFAHRKVNKYAVYSLPDPLFSFYKRHLDYIELHAVDADKRRYAVEAEGAFHYIDIDHYEDSLAGNTDLISLRWKYSHVEVFKNENLVYKKYVGDSIDRDLIPDSIISLIDFDFSRLVNQDIQQLRWSHGSSTFELVAMDSFSHHGLLPFRLSQIFPQLERAFRDKDISQILKLSADMGHYVGDAHVPLHTTKNYNGQLTGQQGIHAFWESRLPELMLHRKHFLTIRPAIYIEDMRQKIWKVLRESHSHVKKVLDCENQTRRYLEAGAINCLDKRQNRYTWIQCPEFADRFDDCLGEMVWDRWEESIHTLGCMWYTAWANAGEPDLTKEKDFENDLINSDITPSDLISGSLQRECEK